jgi:hypothetical protein
MLHPHPVFFNTLANEVILGVNVLAAVMKHQVVTQLDGGLIVNLHREGVGLFFSPKLSQEPSQSNALTCYICGRDILCFIA